MDKPATHRVRLPCLHEGSPAPPPAGKPVGRAYYHCEAGLGVVCRCQCSAQKCASYEADGGEPEVVVQFED